MVCDVLVIEANRVWFVRLKNYLIDRYKRVRLSEKDIGTPQQTVSSVDLPEKPEISVKPLTPYSASITILNESITEEAPYVVRYKSLPQVVVYPFFKLDDSLSRSGSSRYGGFPQER